MVGGALILGAPFAVSAAEGATRDMLAGCWEQASHAPLVKPEARQEWGARIWCFARRGKLISRTFACGAEGCDGWEDERRYRWQAPFLSLNVANPPRDGREVTWTWERCRVRFLTSDWMQLQDCSFSSVPWTREKR